MSSNFPTFLQKWRTKRYLSQLDLALLADVSARHISFLETGRSKPSRQMIAKLAQSLQMPMQDTNLAFLSAGFAPPFKQHSSDNTDMKRIHHAIKITLQNHMPLPAIVLDRHWNITAMNDATVGMLSKANIPTRNNLIDILILPETIRAIENWAEASQLLLQRLQYEFCESGEDVVLGAHVQNLQRAINHNSPNLPEINYAQAVLPTRIKIGASTLSLFSAIAQFGSVFDTQLGDLRIELMYPLDKQTETFFSPDVHPESR